MHTSQWWYNTFVAGVALAAGAVDANGQSGAGKPAPSPAHATRPHHDPRRTEIEVQLAWLADPVTFPHRLEARRFGERLEIHGIVPSRAVHEQALRIARQHAGVAVMDSVREQPVTMPAVKLTSARDLEAAATTALRKRFPQRNGFIDAAADDQGRLVISGSVGSLEEKLALSQLMQRVPGCRCVVNETHLHGERGQQNARSGQPKLQSNPAPSHILPVWHKWNNTGTVPPRHAAQPALEQHPLPRATVAQGKATPTGHVPLKPAATNAKAPPPAGAYETRGLVILDEDVKPTRFEVIPRSAREIAASGRVTPSAESLAQTIRSSCPKAQNVRITATGTNKLRIDADVGSVEESSAVAEQIFAIPSLAPYTVDLQVHVPQK